MPGDFGDLNFLPGNDPSADSVRIDYLRKSNGNPLTGGETHIRVYLEVFPYYFCSRALKALS